MRKKTEEVNILEFSQNWDRKIIFRYMGCPVNEERIVRCALLNYLVLSAPNRTFQFKVSCFSKKKKKSSKAAWENETMSSTPRLQLRCNVKNASILRRREHLLLPQFPNTSPFRDSNMDNIQNLNQMKYVVHVKISKQSYRTGE